MFCGKLRLILPALQRLFDLSATPYLLDRILRFSSYSLRLLIGLHDLCSLPIDHGRWFAAEGGMGALAVVDCHPSSNPGPSLRSALRGGQVSKTETRGRVCQRSTLAERPCKIVGQRFCQIVERRALRSFDEGLDRHAGQQGLAAQFLYLLWRWDQLNQII